MTYDLKNPISADYFASGTHYKIHYNQRRRFTSFEDSSGNYHRDINYNRGYEVAKEFHGTYDSIGGDKPISIHSLPTFSLN